jgi:hypothetical protein
MASSPCASTAHAHLEAEAAGLGPPGPAHRVGAHVLAADALLQAVGLGLSGQVGGAALHLCGFDWSKHTPRG